MMQMIQDDTDLSDESDYRKSIFNLFNHLQSSQQNETKPDKTQQNSFKLDTPCTAGARSAIWRVIHLEIRRLTCFKKMRFGISVKVGILKQKHFFYKKLKKVKQK